MPKLLIAMLVLLVAAGCFDGRPELGEARGWFRSRYPGVQLLDVSNSEDEVIARSYRFRYRLSGQPAEREIEIQFAQDSTGCWTDRPPAPARLP